MDGHVVLRRRIGIMSACIMVILIGILSWTRADVHATTVYSYIDDRGNPVYTDDLRKVPDQYRMKVQRFEEVSESQSVGGPAKSLLSKVLSFRKDISGLSEEQTAVLNYAGGAAVFLLVVMYLSKESPMIRLLALGLLIVLGIGAPVLIYTGQGGALSVIKNKAGEAAQLNDKRMKQVSPQ